MIELNIKDIENIKKEYGLPLYIFNVEEFMQNYTEMEETFKSIYPKYKICYSYKTNYTPAICKCVKILGGYAEVVSDMEYELALRLGYNANEIVYNGPAKGHYFETHLLQGGIANIDRVEEIYRVHRVIENNPGKKVKVGIRVNFDIEAGYTSRFGIDLNELEQILLKFKECGIELDGIHCHMSRARSVESWRRRARTMLEIVSRFRLTDIRYISLGSGMYGKLDEDLKKQFDGYIPDYKDYAEAVLREFADYYEEIEQEKKPIVFTEPGTTLVSKYVDFVAEIEGIKKIRGKEFVLLNCSFHNLGETCMMKNLPIKHLSYKSKSTNYVQDAQLVGYTCLEQDVMYRGFSGNVSIGDYIVFGNVGGYSIVDKPPFIMPNCPMILKGNNKQELIKRQESFDDIFVSFIF